MIRRERKGNIEIISFTESKLNAFTSDEIREQVSQCFSEPNAYVIISLKGVEYIDSTGFGSLLSILRSAKSNFGKLKLCSVEPRVQNLFESLHLNTVFEIYNDIDECLRSFS
jgi:anti-sigma B factor antagonist